MVRIRYFKARFEFKWQDMWIGAYHVYKSPVL